MSFQGNRMKSCHPEKLLDVVQIPPSPLSADFDADFPVGILLDQAEGQTTNSCEVRRSVTGSKGLRNFQCTTPWEPFVAAMRCPIAATSRSDGKNKRYIGKFRVPNSAIILTESNVERPMQAVLDWGGENRSQDDCINDPAFMP